MDTEKHSTTRLIYLTKQTKHNSQWIVVAFNIGKFSSSYAKDNQPNGSDCCNKLTNQTYIDSSCILEDKSYREM